MILRRNFGILWLVAIALLALGQGLHAYHHLERAIHSADHHGHYHYGDSHSHDSAPGNDTGKSHDLIEHSHSPAVLNPAVHLPFFAASFETTEEFVSVPESPVTEIDYPPQLS